jgi:hypothetical protein
MQKKAVQPKIASFSTNSSIFPSIMHSVSFNHSNNFQPGIPDIMPGNTNINVFMFISHLLYILSNMFHVSLAILTPFLP